MADVITFDDLPDAARAPGGQSTNAPSPTPTDFSDIPTPSGRQPLRLTITPNMPEGDIGAGRAALAGAAQGATFNFGDELAGLASVGRATRGGAPLPAGEPEPVHPIDALIGLGRLAYESLTGKNQPNITGLVTGEQPKGEATTAYEEARDRWRATVERAQAQHPAAYLGGNLAGSLAVPLSAVGAPVRAAGAVAPRLLSSGGLAELGTRALRGGITGAAVGGLSGAGEGTDLGSRALQGATGAALGGGIGAAVPVATAPVMAVARPIAQAVTSRARTMFNPTLEAERQVAQTVTGAQERAAARRAAAAVPDTLTRPEMLTAQARGQPAAVLDTAGRGGKRMARNVRNTPGAEEGTEALEGMTQGRFASQADRTANFISRLTAGRNATSFGQLRQRAAKANRPAYASAYAAGDRPIWSPELERLTGSPDIEAAIKSAVRSGKSRAVEEGFGGFNPGVSVTPDGRVAFGTSRRGTPTYPNIQFWDYVSRDLNDMVEKVQGREPDKARYLNGLSQQLKTELDRLVPEFQRARVGAWRHFQAEDAYDAGMKYVQNAATGRKAEELTRQVRNMSAADRVLFMHGFATKLIDDVRKTADAVNIVNKIYNNPAARDRIAEALGANRAREIEAFLRVEAIMNQGKNAVTGNSSTVEQLLTAGAGSALYGTATGNWDWTTLLAGGAAVGGKRLAGRANARVADEIGKLLSSQDPDAYRRGIMLIAGNSAMMDRLRAITDAIGAKALPPQATKRLTDQRGESQPSQ
jgi:hypothetical protein